jgi:ectoine hydroxylase-related dioxygenase (phytanoyl-CoA dioxygenase family)
VRAVTETEARSFRARGWAKLDALVSPDQASWLLDRLERLMADERADRVPRTRRPGHLAAMWTSCADPSRRDGSVRSFAWSPELGRAASVLMGGRSVRFFRDSALVKMPRAQGGGPTVWHQDFSYNSVDRAGQLTFWIALTECPSSRGSLRFLSGSHRFGPLGRSLEGPDDLLERNPELLEQCDPSPPLDLAPGDATVHDSLTVHAAFENSGDRPRVAYTVAVMPADARYTGAPSALVDDLHGLRPNEPFEHPLTPVIWPAGAGASAPLGPSTLSGTA